MSVERLDIVAQVAESLDLAAPELVAMRAQEAAYAVLNDRTGLPPTIGYEIEIVWSALFPEIAEQFFGPRNEYGKFEKRLSDLPPDKQKELQEITAPLDAVLKKRYEATVEAGIPKGKDAYWEHASRPAYAWQTLAAETNVLFEAGLVPEGQQQSLHITLGGLQPGKGGAGLLLSAVELVGSTPQRLLHATVGNRYGGSSSWARRGEDGLRQRFFNKLELGKTTGVELRTLVADSPEQLARTFRTAQTLGAILVAYRLRQEATEDLTHDLAAFWPVVRDAVKSLFAERDLPNAAWGPPHKQPELWSAWADSLVWREDPTSLEAEIVHVIDDVVDEADLRLASEDF